MFFDTVEFKAMECSLKGLALQREANLQNLANYDTPGYKAKSVKFEDVLKNAVRDPEDKSYAFRATVHHKDDTSSRVDGNNVSVEQENIELFQNYMQTSALYQKIGGQFTNLRNVINNALK